MPLRRRTVIYDDRPKMQVVPDCENYEDVIMEKISWLWPNRIPLGQITILMSDPGLGKSTVSADIAGHVTTGRPWPDIPGVKCPQGRVVMIGSEDHPQAVVKPRLMAAGADMKKVTRFKGLKGVVDGKEIEVPFDLQTHGIATFEGLYQKYEDLKLVVIDPVSSYMGEANTHKNSDVRAILDPIAEWAAKRGVAILLINHLNKADKMRAAYRGMGSIAFVAVARMVWTITKGKEDPDLRLMSLVIGNVAPEATTLGYKLQSVKVGPEVVDTAVVHWEGTFDVTAEDALNPEVEESLQSTKRKAADWLKDVLKEGPVKASDIFEMMEEDNICGEKTLRRAKKELRVKAVRKGDHWYWELF